MFNFCELPFCTSFTPKFNGEIFYFILSIQQDPTHIASIKKTIEIELNIEEDPRIIVLL
jgi:hypothetical protein